MIEDLSSEERLRLMRFVCSFAWADLEVHQAERALVGNLARKLGMSEREREQVGHWLKHPPLPEEVDPQDIPRSHRMLFLSTAKAVITCDGEIDPQEATTLELLELNVFQATCHAPVQPEFVYTCKFQRSRKFQQICKRYISGTC